MFHLRHEYQWWAGDDGSSWRRFSSARCHWWGRDTVLISHVWPRAPSPGHFLSSCETFCQDFFLQVTGTKTRSKGWKPFHVAFYSHVTDGSLNFIWGSQISVRTGRAGAGVRQTKVKTMWAGQIGHVPGLLRPIMACAQESRAAFVLMSHWIMSGRSRNGQINDQTRPCP